MKRLFVNSVTMFLLVVLLLTSTLSVVSADTASAPDISFYNGKTFDLQDIVISWNYDYRAYEYCFAVRDIYDDSLIYSDTRTNYSNFTIYKWQLKNNHTYRVFVASEDRYGNQTASYAYFTVNKPITYDTISIGAINYQGEIKVDTPVYLSVTINSNNTGYDRYYYLEAYAVKNGVEYYKNNIDFMIPASLASNTVSFPVLFEESGSVYTKIKVYDQTRTTLLTQRTGSYPDTVRGKLTQSSIRYFNQNDYEQKYGNSTIAISGCGPTSAAMVLSTLLGTQYDPVYMAKFAVDNKAYIAGAGTSGPTLFSNISSKIYTNEYTYDFNKVKNALSGGAIVVASCKNGPVFGNHFIVLANISSNMESITVYDPAKTHSRYYNGKDLNANRQGIFDAPASLIKDENFAGYWIFRR